MASARIKHKQNTTAIHAMQCKGSWVTRQKTMLWDDDGDVVAESRGCCQYRSCQQQRDDTVVCLGAWIDDDMVQGPSLCMCRCCACDDKVLLFRDIVINKACLPVRARRACPAAEARMCADRAGYISPDLEQLASSHVIHAAPSRVPAPSPVC